MAQSQPKDAQPPSVDEQKMFSKLAQLTDRYGNRFMFGNAGDYWHPAFPIGGDFDYRAHVARIRDMDIRPDDVLICSYPKCGLHWNAQIVQLLRTGKLELKPDMESITGFLDFYPMETIDKMASPRILKVHVPFRHLPRQAFEKKIKIILLDRNPKDMLVSFYSFIHFHSPPLDYPGTFEQFFALYMECGYMYGDVFDYMMEWQKGIESHPEVEVCTSVFENLKKDLVAGVTKLNDYLGTGRTKDHCEEIAKLCGFKELKRFMDENNDGIPKNYFKEGFLGLYRKGQVGDWKNWFTVAMNEKFEEEFKKRMANYKRQYIYTLE